MVLQDVPLTAPVAHVTCLLWNIDTPVVSALTIDAPMKSVTPRLGGAAANVFGA